MRPLELRTHVIVREALRSELDEVGRLRVAAYVAGGFLSPSSDYAPALAALGTADDDQVLVAEDGGQLVGTAMLQFWPHGGEVVSGPDEAEVRALAVAPHGQGNGTGRALLTAVIERATRQGLRHLVLLTQPEMAAAQHLYEQAGFSRLTERDWSPVAGVTLQAYGLVLAAGPDQPGQ